jgi:hypothetical protein
VILGNGYPNIESATVWYETVVVPSAIVTASTRQVQMHKTAKRNEPRRHDISGVWKNKSGRIACRRQRFRWARNSESAFLYKVSISFLRMRPILAISIVWLLSWLLMIRLHFYSCVGIKKVFQIFSRHEQQRDIGGMRPFGFRCNSSCPFSPRKPANTSKLNVAHRRHSGSLVVLSKATTRTARCGSRECRVRFQKDWKTETDDRWSIRRNVRANVQPLNVFFFKLRFIRLKNKTMVYKLKLLQVLRNTSSAEVRPPNSASCRPVPV